MSIENLAARHYENAKVVRWYEIRNELLPPEEKLLEVYRDDVSGGRVLDLGCGAGRTTARLHALARDYVGLDYSSAMVESCRQRYPKVNFVHGDATELTMFDAASFDFVLFSYNGLDTMSHANRLRVLGEVYRVLAPGGLFAFSSHNIEGRDIIVALDRSARLLPHAVFRNIKNVASYLRVRKKQVKDVTYSILSDPLAGFQQLTYYISSSNQVNQLTDSGFVDIRILNTRGEFISTATVDRESKWLYYAGRKPGAPGRTASA